ncbi:MAG: class D sortase [Janthinobacterium lividum]
MARRAYTPREVTGVVCRWAGACLLALAVLPYLYGMLFARMQISRFQAEHSETVAWAPGRVNAYRRALSSALPAPEAILRIPGAGMEVPVLEGTSDLVLNRGAGHITGTSWPGGGGNIVIAGHRDGFFRRLKNVAVGDRIEVSRSGGVDTYRVDQLQVVDRSDTSALMPTGTPKLTLVTCYPFFYLGPAPQRYIVRASLVTSPIQRNL